MSIGSRIRQAREQAGLTQRRLAEMIGVQPTAVTNYEKNTSRPRDDVLISLMSALNVDANYIYRDELDAAQVDASAPGDGACSDLERELIRKYRDLDERGRGIVSAVMELELKHSVGLEVTCSVSVEKAPERRAPEKRMIRLYATPAAAGYASPAEGEDYREIEPPADYPEADFAVRIRGDSMEPALPDGGVAYVSRNSGLSDGDVGIFFADGDMLCKQYCIDSRGTLYLFSINRARSDADRSYGSASSARIACLGKVLLPRRYALP